MKTNTTKFPEGFLWGGATSAAQYEGGYDKGGRGLSQLDFIANLPKEERKGRQVMELTSQRFEEYKAHEDVYDFPNRRGSDFYHHYKEDIALMAELGFKVCRMSMAWTRLFPTGTEEKANKEGVAFYHSVFDELHKYGIEPLVTMTHYDVPVYLMETENGWESPKLITYFTHYTKFLLDEYKDKVKYWLTFNEINMIADVPYAGGGMFVDKSKRSKLSCIHQALHHQFVASALTVAYAHQHAPRCQIGNMVCKLQCYPYTCAPADVYATFKDNQFNLFFEDVMANGAYPSHIYRFYEDQNIQIDWYDNYEEILKQGTVDFLSISYYSTAVISSNPDKFESVGTFNRTLSNPYIESSAWGWGIDPIGFRIALNELNDRYHKPIFIAENGLGAYDKLESDLSIHDEYRIEYLKKHIEAMSLAISDGVHLIGCSFWGWIDIVSFSYSEMEKRYGFVYVDADDYGNGSYNRYKKDSFYWYKKVIASNGSNLE